MALNTTGASPAQPVLLQIPDSPSPLVLKVTLRLDPGKQAAFVVSETQKFHCAAVDISIQLTAIPQILSPKLVAGLPSNGFGFGLSKYQPGHQLTAFTTPIPAG